MKKVVRGCLIIIFIFTIFVNMFTVVKADDDIEYKIANAMNEAIFGDPNDIKQFIIIEQGIRSIDTRTIYDIRDSFMPKAYNRRAKDKINALTHSICRYKANLENCCSHTSGNDNGEKLRKMYIKSYIKYLKQ